MIANGITAPWGNHSNVSGSISDHGKDVVHWSFTTKNPSVPGLHQLKNIISQWTGNITRPPARAPAGMAIMYLIRDKYLVPSHRPPGMQQFDLRAEL